MPAQKQSRCELRISKSRGVQRKLEPSCDPLVNEDISASPRPHTVNISGGLMTARINACSSLKWLQAGFATFAIAAIRAAQSLLVMPRISAQPLLTDNKIWRGRIAAGVLLLLGMSIPATAQQATVIGTISDSNAIIVDVKITLTNLETGLSKVTTTNADGQYVVTNLQIGHYAIKAEAKGFKVAEQKGLVLEVGYRRRVDFHMSLGAAAETVTVVLLSDPTHR